MYESKYRIIVDDFGTVVDVGVQLTRLLEGQDVTGRSDLAYADVVFTSMVQFGQTLLDRVPGGNPQNLEPPWDMPTACLLSRAIIDAYQMLAYTSFAPINEPERHLRILVMELHDLERRLQVLHSIYSADPKVSEFEAEATAKRSEILCHPQVASISLARQKKIQKGETQNYILTKEEIDKECGNSKEYREAAWIFLSQYAHMMPMAAHQMSQFRAGTPEALHMISMPMQYAIGYLVKATRQMAHLFGASLRIDAHVKDRFECYQTIVEHGLNSEGFKSAAVSPHSGPTTPATSGGR